MKYLATICTVVLSTGAVKAGDWTGAYVGVQAGYAGGNSTYVVDIFPNVTIPYDPSGWLGGVYVGYTKSVSAAWVAGVEADIAGGGIESGRTQVFNPRPIDQYGHEDVKWQAALRARLGYDMGRALPYLAGGLAVASIEHSVEGNNFYDDFASTEVGATIGFGVDYAVTDRILARAEYRYTNYGSGHYELGDGGALAHTVDLATHDVRMGLAYRF